MDDYMDASGEEMFGVAPRPGRDMSQREGGEGRWQPSRILEIMLGGRRGRNEVHTDKAGVT